MITASAIALTVAGALLTPMSADAAPPAAHPRAATTPPTTDVTAWKCAAGHICFYNKPGGQGEPCQWKSDDDDTATGAVKCAWAATSTVKSVWNRRGCPVAYFSGTGYKGRGGSEQSGASATLAGTHKVRSLRCQG